MKRCPFYFGILFFSLTLFGIPVKNLRAEDMQFYPVYQTMAPLKAEPMKVSIVEPAATVSQPIAPAQPEEPRAATTMVVSISDLQAKPEPVAVTTQRSVTFPTIRERPDATTGDGVADDSPEIGVPPSGDAENPSVLHSGFTRSALGNPVERTEVPHINTDNFEPVSRVAKIDRNDAEPVSNPIGNSEVAAASGPSVELSGSCSLQADAAQTSHWVNYLVLLVLGAVPALRMTRFFL